MILQALKEYYDRLPGELAPEGFEKKRLEFLIVINKKGEFVDIADTREIDGKKIIGKTFEVPRSILRVSSSAYKTAFLLWDHIGYILGLPTEDKNSKKQHQTWLDSLHSLPSELKSDEGVGAVLKFYDSGEFKKALVSPKIVECIKSKPCNMSFMLETDPVVIIPCRDVVKEYVFKNVKTNNESNNEINDDTDDKTGVCLITGERGPIVRTHSKTFINKDANSLVSFQRKSGYDSYGKEQGYNAPIIKSTEFAYVTALNTLLKSSTQKMMIGNTATVFWSQKKSQFESIFAKFFIDVDKDDPSDNVLLVESLLKSPRSGEFIQDPPNVKFYVLGLAQGGGNRICVRFWKAGTIADFAEHIRHHFLDLEIIKPKHEPRFYTINQLLKYASPLDDKDRIPPNIEGDLMRAILSGTPYPATLLQAVLRRVKSDTANRVKPVRAALIKAYFNRLLYAKKNYNEKEVLQVGLDTGQLSIGYHLGRLFAVLEKIQEEANPGLNATIRERYYGAACGSPVSVYPTLMRLKNHHLVKLNRGRKTNLEILIGKIMGHFDEFPAHLNLHEQGKFAIGYYHQRQDLFTSKKEDASDEASK